MFSRVVGVRSHGRHATECIGVPTRAPPFATALPPLCAHQEALAAGLEEALERDACGGERAGCEAVAGLPPEAACAHPASPCLPRPHPRRTLLARAVHLSVGDEAEHLSRAAAQAGQHHRRALLAALLAAPHQQRLDGCGAGGGRGGRAGAARSTQRPAAAAPGTASPEPRPCRAPANPTSRR